MTPTIDWTDSAPLDLAIVGEDRDGYLPVALAWVGQTLGAQRHSHPHSSHSVRAKVLSTHSTYRRTD
jgi:hypothetical protein